MQSSPAAALKILTGLINERGTIAEALHLRALCYRTLGDLGSARADLELAIATEPTAERLNTLGNMTRSAGNTEHAIVCFKRALETDPDYAAAHINLGKLLSEKQDPNGIKHLEKAVVLDPSPLALTSLSDALRKAGRFDEAVLIGERAVATAPMRGSSYTHFGVALISADQPAKAIDAFAQAERLGDNRPQLLDNRIAALVAMGAIDSAKSEADRLTANHPTYLQGHQSRARLMWEYALEGDPFDTLSALTNRYPRESLVWNSYISTLLEFQQHSRALPAIEAAEKSVGTNRMLTLAKAVAASELGETTLAARSFSLLAGEVDPPVFNAWARHLLKSGDAEQAEFVSARTVELDPSNQLAWAYRGTAWRLMDDLREHWLYDYDLQVAVMEAQPPAWDGSLSDFVSKASSGLRRLHTTQTHPANQSLRGGTQTPGALLDRRDPVIAAIGAAVRNAARSYTAKLPEDRGHPFYSRRSNDLKFCGSWSVRLTEQGFHVNHIHQAGWISSAFYFALPTKGEGKEEGFLQLGAPPTELGLDLPPRRTVKPIEGQLALFPSMMWHGTVPFKSRGERLTAAFDLIPV